MEIPQNRYTTRPRNSMSGYLSKDNENTDFRRYIPPIFAAAIYNSQGGEAALVGGPTGYCAT